MDSTEKTYENRLRRMIDRRGYSLRKSRARDRYSRSYGRYSIANPAGRVVADDLVLEGVEKWIERHDREIDKRREG